MPFRSEQHAEAVARRLELLSNESALLPMPESAGRAGDRPRLVPVRSDQAELAAAVAPSPPALPRPGRHAARREASWLPESLRGRVALGPAQVAVVAVALAVGLALTAWWVLRSQPEPLEPSPVGAPLVSPAVLPDAAASAPPELVVDVAGRVRKPGIVVLDPGARVIDAVRAAGGARPRVDLSSVNLARQVVDGEQILVGVAPAPGLAASAAASPGAASSGALVSINTAGASELEQLPGVGPVTAAAIIAFREEAGPFTAVDQLLDVSGIGEATLAEIAPHVTL
jgi:competence protein ComEA